MMGPPETAQFNDPVAQKTEWVPLKGGGSNFGTHRLVEEGHNRMRYKASIGGLLFAGIFIAVGIGVPFLIAGSASQDEMASMADIWVPIGFGLVFFAAGAYMLYTTSKPVVFDKLNGFFWKGWKEPDAVMLDDSGSNSTRLRNIHAIQVIREYVRSDKKSYYSYEINLILKDAERINVVDHGNRKRIMSDADRLGTFLGVPVWKMW